jgi:hypothetical protein
VGLLRGGPNLWTVHAAPPIMVHGVLVAAFTASFSEYSVAASSFTMSSENSAGF